MRFLIEIASGIPEMALGLFVLIVVLGFIRFSLLYWEWLDEAKQRHKESSLKEGYETNREK